MAHVASWPSRQTSQSRHESASHLMPTASPTLRSVEVPSASRQARGGEGGVGKRTSDRDDVSSALVPADEGQLGRCGPVALVRVEVGVAHTRELDLPPHVSRSSRRLGGARTRTRASPGLSCDCCTTGWSVLTKKGPLCSSNT